MPPLMFLPGFGRVCRLIMLTPSTIKRFFPAVPGSTFRTRPRLPRSLPVMTSTLSFLRIGVARRDIKATCRLSRPLKNLRRERDDLHELALAQLPRDWAEHASADRLALVVDQDGRVAIESDVGPVASALFLDGPDDDRLDDLALLHVRLGRRFLHRGGHDIAQARVAPGRSADRIDDRDLARARVVGDVQDRSHLDHGCCSRAGGAGWAGRAGTLSLLPLPACPAYPARLQLPRPA